ncbi:MAG: hypothetical protein ABFD90_19930 [Phycisphaerales bacterium]
MVSALVLTAFIKLLFITDSSRFVAGPYIGMMGIGAIVGVIAGWVSVPAAVLGVALKGALSFAYFWSLLRLKPWTAAWWSVVVGGALLMVFL